MMILRVECESLIPLAGYLYDYHIVLYLHFTEVDQSSDGSNPRIL